MERRETEVALDSRVCPVTLARRERKVCVVSEDCLEMRALRDQRESTDLLVRLELWDHLEKRDVLEFQDSQDTLAVQDQRETKDAQEGEVVVVCVESLV